MVGFVEVMLKVGRSYGGIVGIAGKATDSDGKRQDHMVVLKGEGFRGIDGDKLVSCWVMRWTSGHAQAVLAVVGGLFSFLGGGG